jgi:hypothetical protein
MLRGLCTCSKWHVGSVNECASSLNYVWGQILAGGGSCILFLLLVSIACFFYCSFPVGIEAQGCRQCSGRGVPIYATQYLSCNDYITNGLSGIYGLRLGGTNQFCSDRVIELNMKDLSQRKCTPSRLRK